MTQPTFVEKSIPAISFNRAKENWNRVHVVSAYRDGRHTGQWQSYTWGQLTLDQHRLIAAWNRFGLQPGDRVALMAKNRPRWTNSFLSIVAADLVCVPVYPTLTADDAAFVLRDSGAKYVVADTLEQARKIASALPSLPELRRIIVMDALTEPAGEPIGTYDDLLREAEGRVDLAAINRRIETIDGDHLAAIIYTSGTTGPPKGVMLTHGNFLSQRVVLKAFNFTPEDVFLNHLPFCHSFGLTADLLAAGNVAATLVIAEGIEPEQIRHGLTTIRPTVLMSVPRLFEKLYVEVQRVVGGRPAFVQKLFRQALATGKEVFDHKNEGRPVPAGLAWRFALAKRILRKVRRQAGLDRVRVAYAGGGPTSRQLCYFFQSLGIDIFQGYGLTETSPIATVNVPGKNKLGTVGPAIENVQIGIADDGEILIRGPNVMRGYFHNPEATREAIDADGWFHSGDIGHLDDDGYLTITDRKKELIITSGGKNIAPLAIESAFNTEKYIERVVVVGDGRKHLTALVCPNFGLLAEWAKRRNLRWDSAGELIRAPEVHRLIEARVAEVNDKFARYSQIKRFTLMNHEFSEATGELTPTQKVKRKVVAEMYRAEIESMYPPD